MELSQLKKSVSEIAKTVGAMVEEKLGDRSQIEEQVRGVAKQLERIVTENLRPKTQDVTLKICKLSHFRGDLPKYATAGASGLDVRACIDEQVTLQPMERKLIPTGLSMEIPLGFEVQVRPRSGLAINKGISLVNTPGTIDADYRGEVKIIMINLSSEPFVIQDQDRIAQLVVCPVIQATLEEVESLSETERAGGGFGSTGVQS